jgi:hypothetical protein
MTIKEISIKAIAEILKVKPAIVSNWLFHAAKQCEKVNEVSVTVDVDRFEKLIPGMAFHKKWYYLWF